MNAAFYNAIRPLFDGKLSRSPSFPLVDSAHHRARYAVVSGNDMVPFTIAASLANAGNFLRSKFCRVVLPTAIATLGAHVCKIVRARSNEEVRRIYAWRVVTLVANTHSLRNRPVGQYPRKYVSIDQSVAASAFANHAVAGSGMATSLPFPTVIRAALVNPRPKSFINWFHAGSVA